MASTAGLAKPRMCPFCLAPVDREHWEAGENAVRAWFRVHVDKCRGLFPLPPAEEVRVEAIRP